LQDDALLDRLQSSDVIRASSRGVAIDGAMGHRAAGGRRVFSSVGAVHAGSYDVMVEQSHCEEARRVLASTAATP
jgi:hypothetical protein